MAVTLHVSPIKTPADKYRVRSGVVDADRDRVAAVWRAAGLQSQGGSALDQARFDWFYRCNPQGTAQISFLEHESGGEPIGFLGVAARTFLFGSERFRAGILVDFVVDPAHRSVGPAMKLQRAGRADALRQLDCLYGLPAPQAVAICKRLEHQAVFDMTRFVRVIGSVGFLRRHLPAWLAAPLSLVSDGLDRLWIALRLVGRGVSGEWLTGFDARFDQFWLRQGGSEAIVGLRDRAFLQWRFGEQPGHQYRTFVVTQPKSAAMAMYFVCEITGSVLGVKDFLHDCTDARLTAGLLALAREARKLGASTLSFEVTADARLRSCLRRAQFSMRSTRPVFWMLNESLRAKLSGKPVHITQADEDI